MSEKLYAERNYQEQGQHYHNHVDAMTREHLHAKHKIVGELAHRDIEIERLTAEVERLTNRLASAVET